MKQELTLTFPNGVFTHTDLAQHNGKTNQQIWTAYQKAIKDGTIISAGERPNSSGRGKPSKLWQLNDGKPVPAIIQPAKAPVPKVQATRRAEDRCQPSIVKAKMAVIETVDDALDEKFESVTLAIISPAKPPVVVNAAPTTTTSLPEVKNVTERKPEEVVYVNPEGTLTNLPCPVCKTPMTAYKTTTGYKVWCFQSSDICKSTENPTGHGSSVKAAYEVCCEKWNFAMGKHRGA